MKKRDPKTPPEGHPDRYDWARARRGLFRLQAERSSALLRVLDPEVAAHFPDSRSVNEALHALLALDQALPRRRTRRGKAA